MFLLTFYSLTLHDLFFCEKFNGGKNQSTILESKSQLDAFHGWAHFKKALGDACKMVIFKGRILRI